MKLVILLSIGLLCMLAQIMQQVAGNTPVISSGPAFVSGIAFGPASPNGGTSGSINTTGANFMAACVTHLFSVATTLSDSQSNSWTLVRSDSTASTTQNDLYYVYSPTTNAAQTFTTAGTGSKSGVMVEAFSGMASNPVDQQSGANSTSNQTSYGPGTMVPLTNNEVVIPCATTFLSNPSSISGYSGFQDYTYSGTNHYSGGQAYLIQTSAASTTPSFTIAATASNSAASGATFISSASTIPDCSGCAYISAASTNSGGSAVVSDPTSYTASVNTGTLLLAFGWHTNFSGSGTTTTTDSTGFGLTWRRCNDGGTGAFTDIKVTSTVGMSCNYTFANVTSGSYGATITATDCASNCTSLGGIYVAYSGVFIPRHFDAFCSNAFATASGTTNALTSGTCSPTQANDLVVTYCNPGSTASAGTAGTSPIAFTRRQNTNGSNEDAIYSSASPVVPTMSGTNGESYGCMSVMFK